MPACLSPSAKPRHKHRNDRKIVTAIRIGWGHSFAEGRGSPPRTARPPTIILRLYRRGGAAASRRAVGPPEDRTTPHHYFVSITWATCAEPTAGSSAPTAPQPYPHKKRYRLGLRRIKMAKNKIESKTRDRRLRFRRSPVEMSDLPTGRPRRLRRLAHPARAAHAVAVDVFF